MREQPQNTLKDFIDERFDAAKDAGRRGTAHRERPWQTHNPITVTPITENRHRGCVVVNAASRDGRVSYALVAGSRGCVSLRRSPGKVRGKAHVKRANRARQAAR